MNIPRYARSHGSLTNAISRGWEIFREEGVTGIRRRLTSDAKYRRETRYGQLRAYVDQMLAQAGGANKGNVDEFKPLSTDTLNAGEIAVKAIAFYLPQYHPIPENDAWWGRGFTEWTNVSKAVPQFVGHYQPRLPGELGFYDLRTVDVQRRQIELAKQHGIHGFCYYFYWFGGKRLLERPIDQHLADPTLDFPFCICWANENWTRRWDGKEHEVLAAQNHSPEDDRAILDELERYLLDPRYIRVDGKPVLIVYRPTTLPEPAATIRRWRESWAKKGHGDLYVIGALTFDCSDAEALGFDAALEFPPHQVVLQPKTSEYRYVNRDYKGSVYDYRDLADAYLARSYSGGTVYRTVAVGWDNTARRPDSGVVYVRSTPEAYGQWLGEVCRIAAGEPKTKRLVFINAWNEWAESAYLEPDRRYGYAFLRTTAEVLRQT